jgi:DNA-binding transcriptional LysR family regulator
LERQLGIRLLQRSTRKLEPTEAGLAYFERIEPLLAELRSAHQLAADLNTAPRGVLRVTSGVVYGEMHIVPLLPELFERYPSLSVELILSDASLDLIQERIDVAIRLGTLRDSSYVARRLGSMEFYLCAAQKYLDRHGTPSDPQGVASHNCLLFPRPGYSTSKWVFRSRNDDLREVSINGHCLITNSSAVKQCALAGLGLALLPDWLVGDEVTSGKLIRLFENYDVSPTDFEGAVWLVSPSREYVPLKTRVFTDFMLQKYRAT